MLIEFSANSQILSNKCLQEQTKLLTTKETTVTTNKNHIIYFEHDKYNLTDSSKMILNTICSNIHNELLIKITLIGHTDADGDEEYNSTLSRKRTQTVYSYFLSKGIETGKIKIDFYGDNKPIALNDDEQGKQQNRRVEINIENKAIVKSNIFSQLKKESQLFKVKANKEIKIEGKEGTKISIPANSLVRSNNKKASGEIVLELKEFYSKSDIITSNLHSMSDGKLLETGGMVYITATSSGEKLQLKAETKMVIEFTSNGRVKGMETFIGKSSNGQINWIQETRLNRYGISQKIIKVKKKWVKKYYNSDTYADYISNKRCTSYMYCVGDVMDTTEMKAVNSVDKMILNSGQLGWINCDRFANIENKTNLAVEVDTAFSPFVRLVFKDINSVMNGYYSEDKKIILANVPVGYKATLIAFCIVNTQPYFVSKDIVISKDQKENLKLIKTTMAALKTDMDKLN